MAMLMLWIMGGSSLHVLTSAAKLLLLVSRFRIAAIRHRMMNMVRGCSLAWRPG